MKFNEVTIHTTTAGSEVVSGVLFNEGISCFSVEDPKDLLEMLENKTVPVDYVEEGLIREDGDVLVRVYLAENEQGQLQLEGVLAGIEKLRALGEEWLGSLETELGETDEKDWENNWKQYFHPTEVGNKILIKPEWEDLKEPTMDDTYAKLFDDTVLSLDDEIEENFRKDFSVAVLAEITGISQQYLCRIFKQTMNIRPNEYITCRRLQEAKRLLAETDIPVHEICGKSGFTDAGYFSTVFRKYENISPIEYRRKNKVLMINNKEVSL